VAVDAALQEQPPRSGHGNENAASSSVGTLPPSQVTFVITASSPVPGFWTSRFQPGEGTNESIEKPSGGVNSIFVVDASSFSVGTASVKTWLSFAGTTDGLTCACADAVAAAVSALRAASANEMGRFM
jgi:hypothetical protein